LQSYTSRHITYPSDILPGISGLAREVHNLTGARYLAGIWDGHPDTFIRSLLWRVSDGWIAGHKKPANAADNGSPTWSWASIQAEIAQNTLETFRISQPGVDPEFFLKEVKLASSNPFGQVRGGGKLGVVGYVHTYTGPETFATFRERRKAERIAKSIKDYCGEGSHIAINEDSYDVSVDHYNDAATIPADAGDEDLEVDLDIPNKSYNWSAGKHVLLFMCRWAGEPKPDFGVEQEFLVLRRVGSLRAVKGEKGRRDVFVRVGIAEARGPDLLDITVQEGWERKRMFLV